MFTKRLILLSLLALLMPLGTALAGPLEDLARDLKPVNGYVVLPLQGEFLIDLDASHGVATGDLFTVIQPGEKIIHPITGEVLGTLDVTKGMLKVTQVKNGFSHARAVGTANKIVKGDKVRRFENLRAAFWDYTGKGEPVFAQVKTALPGLNWQNYAAAQAAKPAKPAAPKAGDLDLILVLDNRNLTVRDGAFDILHAYPAPASIQPAVSAPLQPAAPYKLEAAPLSVPAHGVRYEVTFPGFKSLGAIGFETVMADFVHSNGQELLAATDGKTIKIFGVGDDLSPLAETTLSDLAQVLTLHWWQPEENQLCLAVSGWKDSKLSSALFRFEGGKLVAIGEHLPYMFGTFDRNGDGSRELLLTQNFDRDRVWGTVILQGTLTGNDLSLQDVPFELPQRFTVAGSVIADITGNGTPETIFVRDSLLYIYAGTKQLYKSPKMMGGSLSRFLYDVQPFARETEVNYAVFEVPPVASDLDGDGQLELLSIASDSGLISTPGISPGVRKSWLAVLKMRDGMFVKGTLGEELEVPLQGLAVDGKRVLFAATEPGSIFGQGGASNLLVFPLAD